MDRKSRVSSFEGKQNQENDQGHAVERIAIDNYSNA
jgi:hypothetical protein